MTLSPLPTDILLAIFGHLAVHDVILLRQTCKRFFEITNLHSLWQTLMEREVYEKNIPVPGLSQRPLDLLTAQELEQYTCRALKLRRNWTSPSPATARELHFTAKPNARIVALHFVAGRGGRWLVTMSSMMQPDGRPEFYLQGWDLSGSSSRCIAHRRVPQFGGMSFNSDPTSEVILAIKAPHLEVLTIDFKSTDPSSAFVTIVTSDEPTEEVCVLCGPYVLTREGGDLLMLRSAINLQVITEFKNPESVQPEKLLDAVFVENQFAIIIRRTTLEVYGIPAGASTTSSHVQHPLALYHWPWRVDSASVTRFQSPSAKKLKHPSSLNILIRFGSQYPWPINILHHYVLTENESYDKSSGVNVNNLPYHFHPKLSQTIASPIRLFAFSHMIMGSYGTAIWIDSHTEDYYGHSDRGQRIAGKLLQVPDFSDDEDALVSTTAASTAASIVFDVQEEDGWVRIGVEEEEGKIALGYIDGRVTILDYAP